MGFADEARSGTHAVEAFDEDKPKPRIQLGANSLPGLCNY